MRVGFKTGPQSWAEGQKIVSQLGASFCEVWFAVEESEKYTDALQWFRARNVDLGLHHWGICEGGIKANLATDNNAVREQTINQIKQTINIAADIDCVYVNAHPGAACLEKLQFDPLRQELVPQSCTTPERAAELFLAAATELRRYAEEKQVLLTFETIVGAEKVDDVDRHNIYVSHTISPETLSQFAKDGGHLANDIAHTASFFSLNEAAPAAIWSRLMAFTRAVKQSTKLLHINRVLPPYNGTDSHDGISEADWQAEGIPTREQLREFLQVFKNRDDVFVIPEPKGDMAGNFQALQALVRMVEAS
ncbi:MAG: TIM barrel protein [Candidatus Andersenbacteria bacterium]